MESFFLTAKYLGTVRTVLMRGVETGLHLSPGFMHMFLPLFRILQLSLQSSLLPEDLGYNRIGSQLIDEDDCNIKPERT